MKGTSIAFLGAGHLGSSMISGLIANHYEAEKIWATARHQETLSTLKKKFKDVHTTLDNREAVEAAEVIIIAVLPSQVKELVFSVRDIFQKKNPLVISVVAGVTIPHLNHWIGKELPIILSMPNTPAKIGAGATGLYANDQVNAQQKALTSFLFETFGKVVWVKEPDGIHQVLAVSASGVAYILCVMEAMKQAGCQLGLQEESADNLVKQTVLGAAKMALETSQSLEQLLQSIVVPNGTTEQALKVFQEKGLFALFAEAMQAAYNRAHEISKTLDV